MKWVLFALLLACAAAAADKTHDLCAACHTEQVTDFKTHPHFGKQMSCDACHGASVKHRTAAGGTAPDRVAAPDEVPALCGSCHPAQQKEYLKSGHAKLVLSQAKQKSANCATCHSVHAVKAARAMEQTCQRCHATLPESCKKPTSKVARVQCASCHDKHTMVASLASP